MKRTVYKKKDIFTIKDLMSFIRTCPLKAQVFTAPSFTDNDLDEIPGFIFSGEKTPIIIAEYDEEEGLVLGFPQSIDKQDDTTNHR